MAAATAPDAEAGAGGSGTSVLTAERILEVAEEVLRRFGPDKTNVVDVARALGVSHGSVYRHFASKAALRGAVVERWLARVSAPLAEIAAAKGPAAGKGAGERLHLWVRMLHAIKRQKVLVEPEMFKAHKSFILESGVAVSEHVAHLEAQLATIVADGVTSGEFRPCDPAGVAGALFAATSSFHNPASAASWSDPEIETRLKTVLDLLVAGLKAGA
ncbi:TetR/AcrR family transcriptional regulator [Radicibacter daui]|uniref:TetR/AcrR family transcriptional regulator n=1 Tax=Radicibacter daui TaxID=3064829 RepID=UPI0040468C4F